MPNRNFDSINLGNLFAFFMIPFALSFLFSVYMYVFITASIHSPLQPSSLSPSSLFNLLLSPSLLPFRTLLIIYPTFQVYSCAREKRRTGAENACT